MDFAVIDEVATKCPAQRLSKPQGLKIGRDGSKKKKKKSGS